MKSDDIAKWISEKTDMQLTPATQNDLDVLEALHLPSDVINFYRDFEPKDVAEINGVRLWPIAHIAQENDGDGYVPGADIYPHGFVVFATTIQGDVYCVDLTSPFDDAPPSIVIMPHEINFEGMPFETVVRYRKKVAEDFNEFLMLFLDGKLDNEPLTRID